MANRLGCFIFKLLCVDNKKYMWIEMPFRKVRCIRISDSFYNDLISYGVISTNQKQIWGVKFDDYDK